MTRLAQFIDAVLVQSEGHTSFDDILDYIDDRNAIEDLESALYELKYPVKDREVLNVRLLR